MEKNISHDVLSQSGIKTATNISKLPLQNIDVVLPIDTSVYTVLTSSLPIFTRREIDLHITQGGKTERKVNHGLL